MYLPHLILTKEPFSGFNPEDLTDWLSTNTNDRDLATALAEVSNHVDLLGHELDEGDPWLRYAYEKWRSVEKHLYEQIINRTELQNNLGKGRYYLVKPFMEANGYQDGAGWWIKKK